MLVPVATAATWHFTIRLCCWMRQHIIRHAHVATRKTITEKKTDLASYIPHIHLLCTVIQIKCKPDDYCILYEQKFTLFLSSIFFWIISQNTRVKHKHQLSSKKTLFWHLSFSHRCTYAHNNFVCVCMFWFINYLQTSCAG